MRVFLTGGSGLIGSHVAERLRARGDEVVALVRPTTDTRLLKAVGARCVVGDLTDDVASLAPAMAGCDAVVHAAAVVYRRGDWRRYHRINVGGTERVLRAAAAAGVRRAVHVSSIAVYGGAEGRGSLTEERWRERPVSRDDLYARSKREAEEVAWRLHGEGRIRLTTVRPAVVYGEGDRLFTPVLARLVRLPLVPLPGDGRRRVPVVYAGNVAAGIVAALDRPGAAGRAYNLSEDEPLTARALLQGFARGVGRRPRWLPVPPRLLTAFARAADAVVRVVPGAPRPDLRRAARLVLRDNPYPADRARRELEWTDPVRHREALARTAAWYRDGGRGGRGAADGRNGRSTV